LFLTLPEWRSKVTRRASILETIKIGVLAGAAGGLAEILFVTLYALVTGVDAAMLARGVTTASGTMALLPAAPVATGISVHMALSVMLGLALAGLWRVLSSRVRHGGLYGLTLAVLVAVWAINFFVLLPAISPDFVHLVPYAVSLTSKLLFGLAAAEVLSRYAFARQAARESLA
jgi:hypothetical protein